MMNWNKVRIVMGREFSIRVKKKSFLLITILAPLMMAALIILPSVLMLNASGNEQTLAVLDESGLVMPYLTDTEKLNFKPVTGTVEELKADYRNLEADALICISPLDTNRMISLTSWSEKDLNMEVQSFLTRRAETALQAYRMQTYDIENIQSLLEDLNPEITMKTYLFGESGQEKQSIVEVNMVISYVASLLIYMFIFMFGNMVMRSVIDEKSSRIVEVIVSSVKPFELMIGKILGVASVAITQFAIWIVLTLVLLVGGLFVLGQSVLDPSMLEMAIQNPSMLDASMVDPAFMGPLNIIQMLAQIDFPYIVGCFFLYFVLGYLLYAAMFAAVGSAVENEADTQMLVLPITAPLIVGLFIMMQTFQYPDSALSVWASIIPFTSPMVMMARIPFEGGVPIGELLASLGLLFITFLGITWVSAKIYRTGILMYGKKVQFRDLWIWLKY